MKRRVLVLGIVLISMIAKAQTLVVCNNERTPAGWLTISIGNTACSQVGNLLYYPRTIQKVDDLPMGSSLDICSGDQNPFGWYTTAIMSTPCVQIGNLLYYKRTIKKIDFNQATAGTTFDVCNTNANPPGWITIAVATGAPCSKVGNTFIYQRTIEKITGLPVSTTLNICSADRTPAGWVAITTSSTRCAATGGINAGGVIMYPRTIQKIDGMPSGTSLNICGADLTPRGWITISTSSTRCAETGGINAGGIIMYPRTIKKIDGMPSGTVLDVCGPDRTPSGWVTTSTENTPCATTGGVNVGGLIMYKRTIKKL